MIIPLDKINLLTLSVGLARHCADWNWQNVQSPFSRIYLVTEGEAWIHLPSGRYHLTPGHLYIIPAYTMHGYECTGKFTHYYLHVYEEREYETSLFNKFDLPVEVDARPEDLLLMQRLCQLLPDLALSGSNPQQYNNHATLINNIKQLKQHDVADRIEMRGINIVLFSRFMHDVKEKQLMDDERVARILDYIHQHIYEDINLNQLTDISFLSRGYMTVLFTSKVGMSPQQYINKLKIERAQLLLLTDNRPVKAIAYELSFTDHSYFVRLFKKFTGLTPLQYRETNVL